MFKINHNNLPGIHEISVPTDSVFALGIGNGKNLSATIHLYDGETELSNVLDSGGVIPYYKIYEITSSPNQETKYLKATVSGTVEEKSYLNLIDIRLRVFKSNVSDI